MSSNDKSNVSNLEDSNKFPDYGNEELNKLFQTLDVKTKEQITKYTKKEVQLEILKNLSDPQLTEIWNNLPDHEKKNIDAVGLRDRFIILKGLLKNTKLHKFSPHTPDEPIPHNIMQNFSPHTPDELFDNDLMEHPETPVNVAPVQNGKQQERFDKLVTIFYNTNPYNYNPSIYDPTPNHELEVRFGTKGIRTLTRNDYDNVIRKLKSSGFKIVGDSVGEYYLRVNCEFLDSTTGRFKLSDIRTEIKGLHNIQEYCKTNDIKSIYKSNPTCVVFIHKKMGVINKERIYPVDFDEFNFRVSYQTEEKVKKGIQSFILENWRKSKKEFRFLNRVSLEHPDHPCLVDITISKFANRSADRYGRANKGPMIRVYTLEESNVFENPENYEMEIEVNNNKIGPSTKFNRPDLIVASLRKVIKYVLCGLQGTNYPISYPEQKHIIDAYMQLMWKDEPASKKFVSSKNFIGPNSITLQLKNISPMDENSNETNIRKDFVVTDKADGERHLMFISDEGKIYLINTSMDVIFTGAKTENKECFNTLMDGELILHDKNGRFINLYAAFDVYYIKRQDVRAYTFMLLDKEDDIYKSRYQLLKYIEYNLKATSITATSSVEKNAKTVKGAINKLNNDIISPIRFSVKEFFPNNNTQSIFDGCNTILQKEREGRFEYTTDGLIFTHAFYGVGASQIGKAGPNTKITWEYSFKWKPPQYNTIDFLITTVKGNSGEDLVKSLYEEGINNDKTSQYSEYKTIELRCGFKESKDGFINPCQDVIDDKIPEFVERFEDRQEEDYLPKRFYPTEPYDVNAGICNIMLRIDGSGSKKMFSEENEVFEDNTIVEFRYDLDKEDGWKWVPLRVRYDKTAKLRRGEKEYGNSYKVCNENWKSIHPSGRITEDMISTGINIPTVSVSEDIYYNTPSGKFKTEAMKNFHNLYVKRKLIVGSSKQGDTLIDFACGKAGDLPKWISAKLSFVFGIDISTDNLENRLDGACARFLKMKKSNKHVPYALFVNGNSAFNIKDGSGLLNDKAKQITAAVFGKGVKDAEKIGKGVARQYGKGADGFNVSSCQFAIHYFLENPDTLKGFMKNISECTKQNGYFIGTCYDGKLVFNELKKTKTGDSIKIVEDGRKIWEITKSYGSDTFDDDSSSIGYRVDVYQESINQTITEYLVNFDYLNRVMSAYGFELVEHEEALQLGMPNSTGLFSELFLHMLEEISKNKYKANEYDKAPQMTSYEKKISFLNRYFIYKKIRTVNTENVELEIGEYNETASYRNYQETMEAQEIAQDETNNFKFDKSKTPTKVRKLTKKIMLVPATEAIDEPNKSEKRDNVNKTKKVDKKENASNPGKNKTKTGNIKKTGKLIIENDDEEE